MVQTFKVEIKGQAEFAAAAKKWAKKANIEVDRIMAAGAIETEREAKSSIQEHRSKGRIYLKGKNNSIAHSASTEGNPPNTDTGNLVRNIRVEKIKGGYDVGSRKGAPYGMWLEFGTSKMGARPWLTPAYKKAIKYTRELFEKAKV